MWILHCNLTHQHTIEKAKYESLFFFTNTKNKICFNGFYKGFYLSILFNKY